MIRVVNANMERAIRVITVERGFDPRDFALLAFGGAGPMHACELALDLGIRRIVMPRNPGLLCAWGATSAPLGREYSLTVRETNPSYRGLLARAAGSVRRARKELADEGARRDSITSCGPICVIAGNPTNSKSRLTPRFIAEFHSTHRRTFGHSSAERRGRGGESPLPRGRRRNRRHAEANRPPGQEAMRLISRMDAYWSETANARCRSTIETHSARARACADLPSSSS